MITVWKQYEQYETNKQINIPLGQIRIQVQYLYNISTTFLFVELVQNPFSKPKWSMFCGSAKRDT